jgi:hypothetical protein
LLVGLLATGAAIRLYLAWQKAEKEKLALAEELQQRQKEEINHMIGQGEGTRNFLGEMHRFLYDHPNNTEAHPFIEELLGELQNLLEIRPVEEYGKQVRYNPEFHLAFDVVKPGERVMIVDPGWKHEDALIRKPTVRVVRGTSGGRNE